MRSSRLNARAQLIFELQNEPDFHRQNSPFSMSETVPFSRRTLPSRSRSSNHATHHRGSAASSRSLPSKNPRRTLRSPCTTNSLPYPFAAHMSHLLRATLALTTCSPVGTAARRQSRLLGPFSRPCTRQRPHRVFLPFDRRSSGSYAGSLYLTAQLSIFLLSNRARSCDCRLPSLARLMKKERYRLPQRSREGFAATSSSEDWPL